MPELVIVDALRTPIGKRGGGLSGVHPATLLGDLLKALVDRTGIDPAEVGQVLGGCVDQVGEQANNVARTAWLAGGLPESVGATSLDAQCGSSQQATGLAAALVTAEVVDVAIGCGVESMSRVPMGSNMPAEMGHSMAPLAGKIEATTQFEGAERIAARWGIDRNDADAFGLRSQQRAAAAWADGRFDGQIVPVGGVERDEGLRASSLEGLAKLKPIVGEGGVHTAGSASQISDGASAVLVTTAARADALGLKPRARIIDTCLVGSDPVLMLTGPIEATNHLLRRGRLKLQDVDVFEVNEAFASVVLAWQREFDIDPDKINPNGGAIALGHPLGATGGVLITKAVHELGRRGGGQALVTMCCGGGLGTGMLIEAI